MSLFKA